MRKIDSIVIHCSASPFGDVELIDEWHKARKFDGIGYHFVICNNHPKSTKRTQANFNGKVLDGRAIEKMGAHAKGFNRSSIGICIIGDDRFTPRQLDSLLKLLCKLCIEYKINPDRIFGHFETYPEKFDKSGRRLPPPKTCPNLTVEELDNIRDLVATRTKGWS